MFQTRSGFCLACAADADSDSVGTLMPSSFSLRPVRRLQTAPFASVSMRKFSNLGEPASDGSFISLLEAQTGLSFPLEYCHKTQSHCPLLTGLGVRAKKILGLKNINVYALGIYVDVDGAKKALGHKYKHAAVDSLEHDQAFYNDVAQSSAFEKTLKMVISFGSLRRAQFVEALEERLAPKLKEAGEAHTMEQFKALFDGVTFKRGLDITFVQNGNDLVAKVDGQQRGVISSTALCKSLFDIYLGADTVTPDAKTKFGHNLASALHSAADAAAAEAQAAEPAPVKSCCSGGSK